MQKEQNMNFLDTIGNLLDLSKKQQNFAKDIENLQKILEALQEGLRQANQNDLPLYISELLNSHLKETEELLQHLSQRRHSWWAVVQKLVPGSDIWKLKTNYEHFLHINKVLNLYLTMGKKSKRSALSCLPLASEVMYGSVPTKRLRTVSDRGMDVNLLDVPLRKSATSLNLNNSSYRNSFPPSRMNSLNRTTSTSLGLNSIREESENRGKLAFKLKLLYEVKLEGFIRQYRIVQRVIEEYWGENDHKEFIFRREDFNYLPIKESTKLSRDHAALIVTRQLKKKIVRGDTESSNVMIEEEPNKSTTSQEDDEYEYRFVLRDLSLNGTYYLKGAEPEDNDVHGAKVVGDFAQLTKNTEVELNHGDIIGLIMQKPACKELTFGFQLFTH